MLRTADASRGHCAAAEPGSPIESFVDVVGPHLAHAACMAEEVGRAFRTLVERGARLNLINCWCMNGVPLTTCGTARNRGPVVRSTMREMAPPTWLASYGLKVAGWAVRNLDRRLAIRVDVDGEEIGGDNPDEWLYVIRIFNGTNDAERIHDLQFTFSGGAPPLTLRVPNDAVVDRTHNFETKFEEFIVSAHEDQYRHEHGRNAFFNGVRVRFHSGRDVWRPARGFRPMSWTHRLQWRLQRRLRRLRRSGRTS